MGDEHEQDEVVEGEAAVLPAREAMSLISPTPDGGFMPDLAGEENATSEDPSGHFGQPDSASSEP